MTKLICAKCGAINPAHAKYLQCTNCGRMLADAEEVDV